MQAEVPVQIGRHCFDYAIENVRVCIYHLGKTGPLTIENQQGQDWYHNLITGQKLFETVQVQVRSTPGLAEIWDGLPRVHNNLWVTTTPRPRTEARFLAVIVPSQQGEERPHVSKRELDVVEVTCDGKTDVIAFNPQYAQAPIAIDIEGIRNSAVFDRQQLTEIARHL